MIPRVSTLVLVAVSSASSSSAFEILDDMLRLAHLAPWTAESMELAMLDLAGEFSNNIHVDRGNLPQGLEDEDYWIVGLHLELPLGKVPASGLLACSRIGRDGWTVVLEQPPYGAISTDALPSVDFMGFFADEPIPFPDGAMLRLECFATLVPSSSIPVPDVQASFASFADRIRDDYSVISFSEEVSEGYFSRELVRLVATGGSDYGDYRLDDVKLHIDPSGALNFEFSAWAMVGQS